MRIVKYYKHNNSMKILTIIGGFLGFIYCYYGILNMRFVYKDVMHLLAQLIDFEGFLGYFTGMFIAALTLLVAFKPNDPIPWNWILLLTSAILLMVNAHVIAGIPVLFAAIIGLFSGE
ncbi:MAG: hypothetical protein ACXABO_16050 [Promethearchaeota archaeon]